MSIAAIVCVNYMDRSILSFAYQPIISRFSLSHQQFGMLFSTFFLAAIAGNLGCAVLLRVVEDRCLWVLSAVVWSLSLYMQTNASSYHYFQGLRFVMGLAEGFVFPLLSRVVCSSGQKSALTSSLLLLGIPLSNCISSSFFSSIMAEKGWVFCFHLMSFLGCGLALLLFIFLFCGDGGEQSRHRIKKDSRKGYCLDFYECATNYRLIAAYLAAFASGSVIMFCMIWLPDYLQSYLHISLHGSMLFEEAPWITSCLVMLCFGFICERVFAIKEHVSLSYLYLLAVAMIFSGICLSLLFFSRHEMLCVVLITLAVAGVMGVNSALFMVIADCATAPEVATGVMAIFFLLSCLLSGPFTGYMVDITGHFYMAFLANAILLFVTALVILITRAHAIAQTTYVRGS